MSEDNLMLLRPYVLLLLFFLPFSSSAVEVEYSSYIKPFLVAQQVDVDSADDRGGQGRLNGRVMLDFFSIDGLTDEWTGQLHYELEYKHIVEEIIGYDNSASGVSYRLSDLNSPLNQISRKKRVRHNLDRFSLQYTGGKDDVVIGRQAVAFGASRVISPFDIFIPYQLQDLNTEYRVGVDGIRWTRSLDELSEVDTGVVVSDADDGANYTGFIRGKTSWYSSDIEAILIKSKGHQVLGFGVQTSLDDFGVWAEFTGEESDSQGNAVKRYGRASFGADYGFNEDVYGLIEFHYNGVGVSEADQYVNLLQLPVYQNGSVYLLGKSYFSGLVNWTWSALVSTSYQVMLNLNDRSSLLSANLRYSLADESDLGVGVFLPVGDGATLSNLSIPIPHSEFGVYPRLIYINVNYYF